MLNSKYFEEVDLFSNLSKKEIEKLAKISTLLALSKGNDIALRTMTNSLLICHRGRAMRYKLSITGTLHIDRIIEPQQFVPLEHLFQNKKDHFMYKALMKTEIIRVDKKQFEIFLTDNNKTDLMQSLLIQAAKESLQKSEEIADRFYLDIPGRTAKLLLKCSNDYDTFDVSLNQEQLAGLVGGTRERVNKAINSFIKSGWLTRKNKRYQIINRPALEQVTIC